MKQLKYMQTVKQATLFVVMLLMAQFVGAQVSIASVTSQDLNGEPTMSGASVTVTGIVYGVDLRQSLAGIAFTLIDNTGGINCFSNPNDYGYTVQEGDSLLISGTIGQFNGLTQIMMDNITYISSGHKLKKAAVTKVLDETIESQLIKLKYLTVVNPTQWTNAGSGFSVDVSDGTNTYVMRIDDDVDLYNMAAPVGLFHLTGIGSQYDPSLPYFDGYQIIPRYSADIELITMNSIATLRPIDGTGVPTTLGKSTWLGGVVYGVNTRNTEGGIAFTIRDQTGGIGAFSGVKTFGYTVKEGDSLVLGGSVGQFNGLTQLSVDTLIYHTSANPLMSPLLVNVMTENTESDLIKLANVSLVDPAQWTNSGSGFNLDLTDGTLFYRAWIDNDCNLFGKTPPTSPFELTGIGSQFDALSPYLNNYQINPRYQADLLIIGTPKNITTCGSYQASSGEIWTVSGLYRDIISNPAGYDTLVEVNLTITAGGATGVDVQSACGTYTWIDGQTYTTSNNTATHNLVGAASNGCDSLVTLNLTIMNAVTGVDIQKACGSYTWINGQTYTTSNNTATHNLIGAASNGCDSLVTLNLTIGAAVTGVDVQTACGSFTWIDGQTYTSNNNTAVFNIVGGASGGCDSIVQLNLSIVTVLTGTDVQTACGAYTWIDGQTYTTSNNTATHNLVGAGQGGCDSLVTLNLTIGGFVTGTDVQKACGSFTWIDGQTYTSDNNTATFTLVGGSTGGCDSIVTLNLTFTPLIKSITNTDPMITANESDASYQWLDCSNNFAELTGETGQSFTATTNGEYAVKITRNDCVDTSTCVTITQVGLTDLQSNTRVQVYPNPTSGEVFISLENGEALTVEVRDLQGRLLQEIQSTENVTHFSLNGAAGVYYLRMVSGTKLVEVVKVVKE